MLMPRSFAVALASGEVVLERFSGPVDVGDVIVDGDRRYVVTQVPFVSDVGRRDPDAIVGTITVEPG